MQHVVHLMVLAIFILQSVSSENFRNSSILFKRCSNDECYKSKSLIQVNKSPSFFGILKYKLKRIKVITVNCTCVPIYFCSKIYIHQGYNVIDLRSRRCVDQLSVCCYPQATTIAPSTTTRILPTVPTTQKPSSTTPQNCYCIPIGLCPYPNVGQIDPRQTFCGTPGMVCCQVFRPVTPACYCAPIYQCSGPNYYQIDPRFGQPTSSCGDGGVMCCNRASSANIHALPSVISTDLTNNLDVRNAGTNDECFCTKSWQCSGTNIVTQEGVDPRLKYCSATDEVCCKLQRSAAVMAGGNPQVEIINPVQTPFIINNSGGSSPNVPSTCGIRGTAPSNVNPSSETTYFAEFPWMVALLLRQSGMNDQQLCGASMINTKAVLTAAHCLFNRPSGVLVARFGQWDIRFANQSLPYQEANVKTISTHPQYNSVTLYYDVAVLILDKAVNIAANVKPICLPSQGMNFAPGTSCWASGWGRNAFGNTGMYQTVLKKVDLPIVDKTYCQQLLRNTRLGPYFNLHGTFICAGGQPNKDTCQGDGGGPLVCPLSNGQYFQAGIVSWGIGCGSSSVPAVYASVAQLRTWIDQQLATYGV